MKYKLILMFIFSFLVHITIAGALVYVPYQVSMHDQEDLVGEVIWGRIYKAEGRSKKLEVRSKKQEARSQKLEVRSKMQEARSEKLEASSEEQEVRVDNSGEMGGAKEDENVIPTKVGIQPHVFVPDSRLHGNDGDDLNASTGNDDRVLLASSAGEQSHTDEGDEVINAEKRRIYNEQLKGLIEQVKKEIEKNKYYPFLAKLKGIEGTVYVNFHIGQDGKPGSVAIQKSSGSVMLDDSSVKTIKNLKPFRNINPELRELDITVPITYRLKEEILLHE